MGIAAQHGRPGQCFDVTSAAILNRKLWGDGQPY